jgi:hypothetical protein
MSTKKLNVVLATTDNQRSSFTTQVKEYTHFFKNKQGSFLGEKKTYEAAPDTIDLPSERSNTLVVTTVGEKLQYLEDAQSGYIDSLFALEATNASNTARAELVVDGVSFGEYSSLELLRLKSLLESTDMEHMYSTIPVRSDSEIWTPTTAEEYAGRPGILENSLMKGEKKSTQKTSYILDDPNLQHLKDQSGYKPQLATHDEIITLGQYTRQQFSGQWSHRERAELLRRRSILLTAVIAAIKVANDVEVVESQMTAQKLFGFLHWGTMPE